MTFGRVKERHGSSKAASAENSRTCTNFNRFFLITCSSIKKFGTFQSRIHLFIGWQSRESQHATTFRVKGDGEHLEGEILETQIIEVLIEV